MREQVGETVTADFRPMAAGSPPYVHTGRSPFTVTRVPARVCGQ
jgi:hypothetical protein